MSFKLKMKVLLFLVSSVVSFSAQNENFQMNIKNNDAAYLTIFRRGWQFGGADGFQTTLK